MNGPWVAVVVECPFEAGRWLMCRRNKHGWETVESDHPTQESAELARRKRQAEFDFQNARPPVDSSEPRQLVLGFYTDEDAA